MARRIVASARHNLGWRTATKTALVLGAVGAARAAMRLDPLVHRHLEKIEVDRPLFILGAARSGTTMLHRLLARNGDFCVFRAWELMTPSLLHRRLVAPVAARASPRKRYLRIFPDDSHDLSWDSIEEEELLLLGRLDTQMLLSVSALAFDAEDPPGLTVLDDAPRARDSVAWLRSGLQRQIRATGRTRVVAKMPYSTTRVRTLAAEFPDARFVYLVRSPLETVPSHLSMLRTLHDRLYGLDRVPAAAVARFWDRRYRLNVATYRYFEDVLDRGDLAGRVLVLRYPDLVADPVAAFERVATFAELPVSAALRAAVHQDARQQRDRARPHTVSPSEAFGISRERIIEDLGIVFDRHGFARD